MPDYCSCANDYGDIFIEIIGKLKCVYVLWVSKLGGKK